MQQKFSLTILALSLATAANLAHADNENSGNFSGSGEAGYNQKTGNTVSETLLAKLKLDYEKQQNEYKSLLEAENKEEDGVKTSERYVLDLQYNRYFSTDKSYYGFINARGEQDKLAGTDTDYSGAIGAGKILFKTDATKLSGEVGVGYQDVKFVDSASNDLNYDQTTYRAKLDFSHKFNDAVRFVQDVLYLGGSDSYKIETNSSLRASLSSKLSAAVSYKYRYNDKVETGMDTTDTETNFSLIYSF